MRIFQNSNVYPGYLPTMQRLIAHHSSFTGKMGAFLDHRFGAPHLLLPVLERSSLAFFANSNHEELQRCWATEQGMSAKTPLATILLAQIEHHRSEVFYNMDPLAHGSDFVRRLPSCVRKSIAWRAAPSPGADFDAYDLVVCNFPGILQSYRDRGWRAAHFSPAHDPEMDSYATNTNRPIDVVFVGGYTRHHRQRAEVLEAVAAQHKAAHTVFYLDRSRLTRLAESTLGRWMPLERHRRPVNIVEVTAEPVFGRDLYAALSKAKIVLNGAVDMAGLDRGNMRCFEAMGCGAAMVSDQGNYPAGMVHDKTMLTYSCPQDAVKQINTLLAEPDKLLRLANAGHSMVSTQYTKESQWQSFRQLVGNL